MNSKYINRKALQAVALFFGLAFTACSTEDEFTPPTSTKSHTVTITATQPSQDAASRMGYNDKGNGYWHKDDALSVVYIKTQETEGKDALNSRFDLTEGAGQTRATFTGTMDLSIDEAYTVMAFYPYNENHTYFTYNLPNSYTYDGVNTDYTYTEDGKSANMPMYCRVKDASGSDLQPNFMALGSVLAIKVNHLPAAAGTITITANEVISGNANFKPVMKDNKVVYNDAGQILMHIETPTEGEKTVTFNYSNATVGQSGVFYLPLPDGTYTGVKVTVAGASESDPTYTGGGDDGVKLTLERGHIKKLKVNTDYDLTIDGHKFINLGLQSGTLWAETNIGAATAADCGGYYAWGETETKDTYMPSNYNYFTQVETGKTDKDGNPIYGDKVEKYNGTDCLYSLESIDDAATSNWGAYCAMPTQDMCNELLTCTWEWTTQTNSSNESVSGYKVTSKSNGKSIFLPCTGFKINSSLYDGSTTTGYYWSKDIYPSITMQGYLFSFSAEKTGNMVGHYRPLGCAVRAVIGQ